MHALIGKNHRRVRQLTILSHCVPLTTATTIKFDNPVLFTEAPTMILDEIDIVLSIPLAICSAQMHAVTGKNAGDLDSRRFCIARHRMLYAGPVGCRLESFTSLQTRKNDLVNVAGKRSTCNSKLARAPAPSSEPSQRPQMLPMGSSRMSKPASAISFLTNLHTEIHCTSRQRDIPVLYNAACKVAAAINASDCR